MPFDFEGQGLSETAKVLLRAAEIVMERWQQGDYGQSLGPRCVLSAIIEAADANSCLIETAHLRLCRVIDHYSIANWNDHPSRTKEEVARALEMAAFGSEL